MASKLVRVGGIALGALIFVALVGLWLASLMASTMQRRTFGSHRIDIAVPYPLSAAELDALRAQRIDAGVAPGTDPLAGVDLGALASERAIARGKHLVEARYACDACHGKDFGGGVMIDDAAFGELRGPNITSGKGGVVARYGMDDWDRIVRHGIKPDGSPAIMPSEDFFAMSDRELSDIVAYLRSRPPVDALIAKPSFGPVGKILLALGKLQFSADRLQDHWATHIAEPPTNP